MTAYYNENEPYAAQWLRNLIAAGHIAAGDVDDRSIADVQPADLVGYDQCHFFAGIGIWSAALRQAGWVDDRAVWTGSCPCQPFSAAGKRGGTDDARHLWPVWFELIRRCRPVAILGEQVASKDGLNWLDIVHTDLETAGYAAGAVDLCAAGVGAPHIRQRLWFMAYAHGRDAGTEGLQRGGQHGQQPQDRGTGCGLADTNQTRFREQRRVELLDKERPPQRHNADGRRAIGELGDPSGAGLARPSRQRSDDGEEQPAAERAGGAVGTAKVFHGARRFFTDFALDLADPSVAGRSAQPQRTAGTDGRAAPELGRLRDPGPANGFWSDADWIPCTDGKARPVESGTFPLAHGDPQRVGRLRAYGNAINQEAAAAFIAAADEAMSLLECL